MKPNGPMRSPAPRGPLTKMAGLAALLFYVLLATVAQASTVLIAETTLVTGSQSTAYSFNAPGPGTVSVQLTNLSWPQALSSLSFMATNGTQVLSPWSSAASGTQVSSFQVGASGTYFADIMAAAAGPLDLGVYSLSLTFAPAVPVPLPAGGPLLLGGAAGLLALIRRLRGTRTASVQLSHRVP